MGVRPASVEALLGQPRHEAPQLRHGQERRALLTADLTEAEGSGRPPLHPQLEEKLLSGLLCRHE